MAKNSARKFRAVIEPLSGGLGWVVARLPFDIDAVWDKMVRLRQATLPGSILAIRRLRSWPAT